MYVFARQGQLGWGPIDRLARLTARLLGASFVEVPSRMKETRWTRLRLTLGSKRPKGESHILLICPRSEYLFSMLAYLKGRPEWSLGGILAVWLIDSFWERESSKWQIHKYCDHLFVMNDEDIDYWSSSTRYPTTCLPWGSDVLTLGSGRGDRATDVQRLGRQPPEWTDDDESASKARCRGLIFRGRPPFSADPLKGHAELVEQLASAKYVLAFSNSVDQSCYTHPRKAYITGRWTDAIAAGCVVAGVAPDSSAVRRVLWPEALLDLGSTRIDQGLDVLQGAVQRWTPDVARYNYWMALQRLDWRWRIQCIAEALCVESPVLNQEIGSLNSRVEELRMDCVDSRCVRKGINKGS